MPDSVSFYIALLALIIIGVLAVKKMASCLIKTIVVLVLVAAGAYIYYRYLAPLN